MKEWMRMNDWTKEWTDVWMNRWVHAWKDGWMIGWMSDLVCLVICKVFQADSWGGTWDWSVSVGVRFGRSILHYLYWSPCFQAACYLNILEGERSGEIWNSFSDDSSRSFCAETVVLLKVVCDGWLSMILFLYVLAGSRSIRPSFYLPWSRL